MATLGTKIKKIRELKNYSQDYMAEKLGISQSAYSKMESGETEVSNERLSQIAKVLEVSTLDIISFDEKVFFNVTNRDHSSGGTGYTYSVNNYGLPENERRLYEDNIKSLQEKIQMQAEMIEMLKKEIERLKPSK